MSESKNTHKEDQQGAQTSEQGGAQPGDPFRDYNENERPILRVRAQRALRELEKRIDDEQNAGKKKEIESAIGHLERIVECMADEPMSGITPDALENNEWFSMTTFDSTTALLFNPME